MKKMFLLCLLVLGGALLGCSTMYQASQSDIWAGKRLMKEGDYGKARENFVKASQAAPDQAYPYALAAMSSYKMNDINAASRFIEEAAKRDRQGNEVHIRILGYRALILLREGKEKEGLKALNDYMVGYQQEYGEESVSEVRAMTRADRIDLVALQDNLDREIEIYESDMEQIRRSGTGWIAMRHGNWNIAPTGNVGSFTYP